jgi:hypothetical protein
MSRAKQLAILILLGVGALVLAIIVLATTASADTHLLAVIGLLGGLAMVVVSLPTDKD